MKTHVIHATCRYVVQNKITKQTESGQSRPTLAIEASSERAAVNKARKQMLERYKSEHWPVVSLSLIPELVNVQPAKALRSIQAKFADLDEAWTECSGFMRAFEWWPSGDHGRDAAVQAEKEIGRR